MCVYLLSACHQNTASHNHAEESTHVHEEGHDHSGHDNGHEGHDHEGHNHDHEGHDHEGHDHEHHDHEGHDHDHEAEEAVNPNEIVFPQEKAAVVGLQVQTVQPGAFTQVVKTSGRIVSAQGDERALVAVVSGVVSFGQTRLVEGAALRKGQTVLSLVTGHLPEGDVAVRTRVAFEKAKSDYERAKGLIGDKIISEREFNQLKADYETAKVAYEAIGGASSGSGVGVTSPMNGYLKNLQVKEGDYVSVGQPLATVSQNNRLVLRAEVSEKYYASLPLVQSAHFKTPYEETVYKLSELNGRLLSYAKSSTDNSFYIPVTFEFDNKGSLLSGAYVDVWLLTAPLAHVLTVPVTALIEEQGVFSVFLRLDETCYTKQTVQAGVNNGSEVQILSGLKAGDTVVTEGAYHLKLASASNAMPAHTHNH